MSTIFVIFCSFIVGLQVAIYLLDDPAVYAFIVDFLRWLIYTLPRYIFVDAPAGLHAVLYLSLNIIIFVPLVFMCWTVDHTAKIYHWTTMLAVKMRVFLLISLQKVLPKAVLDSIIAVAVGVKFTVYTWNRQGHCRTLRIVVLVPGLIFAMFINAVMYMLLFLPMTILDRIWDTFFAECPHKSTEYDVQDYGGADTISELDLNEPGEEVGHKDLSSSLKA